MGDVYTAGTATVNSLNSEIRTTLLNLRDFNGGILLNEHSSTELKGYGFEVNWTT